MRISPVIGAAALVAVVVGSAGCAEAPPLSPPAPSPIGQGSARAEGPSCPRLFVSPSGEPFRRAPGGACPLEAWFAGADADHDGTLDRAESRADAARFFAKLDQNGDGVIDAVEVQRYEREIVPEILGRSREAMLQPRLTLVQFGGGMGGGGMGGGGMGGGRGGGGRHRGGAPAGGHEAGPQGSPDGLSRYSLLDEPEPVASADLNFDGRITAEEFLTLASVRFDTLTTAVGGALTLPALQARMATRGGDRQRPGTGRAMRRHRT